MISEGIVCLDIPSWVFLFRNPTSFLAQLLEGTFVIFPHRVFRPSFTLHLQCWSCWGLGCPCELQQVEDRSLQIYAHLAPLFTGKVFYPIGKSVLDHWSYRSRSRHQAKSFSELTMHFPFPNSIICKFSVAGCFIYILEERSSVIGFSISLWWSLDWPSNPCFF